MFFQNFGGGCIYSSGEDSLFLKACFERGLKVYSNAYVLGSCCKDVSSWFRGFNEKYFYDKEQGIYLDCNVVDGGFSEIVSAVSVYPYAYGISTDQAGLKKVVSGIETEKGITVAPNRGKDVYYQWDYPCMWPAATCIIYKAFKALGMYEDAKRIAMKYNTVVDENFVKTGRIWEKYDAVTGGIGYSNEYDTPEMMGWTAGVYVYFEEELKKLENVNK